MNRCSRLAVVLAVCALLSAAVVPAAAVSVEETDVPESAEVGSQVTATFTLTALYDTYETWQLAGSTELRNVTWTVTFLNQAGDQIRQKSYDGQEFSGATVDIDEGTARVEVRVVGTVPAVDSFSYDPQQSFTIASLTQTRAGGSSNAIADVSVTHYTADSREARQALESARQAIDAAGNPQSAEETFQSAVNAYEAGNFDNAVTLAQRAEREARSARNTSQRNRLLLYGVGGLLVVGALVGGVVYWRSQQDSYDKLG